MAVLRYDGPWDVRPLWGVDFHRGQTVVVDDPKLVAKARNLEGFTVVEEDEAAAPAPSQPDPRDYAPIPDAEPAELLVPIVAPGTIPENWREMHWRSRVKLAKELSGMDDITTAEGADATIEALLKPQ